MREGIDFWVVRSRNAPARKGFLETRIILAYRPDPGSRHPWATWRQSLGGRAVWAGHYHASFRAANRDFEDRVALYLRD